MNTDPRIMAQLLRLGMNDNLLSATGSADGAAAPTDSAGNSFASLLQLLMLAQSPPGDSALSGDPAGPLALSGLWNVQPPIEAEGAAPFAEDPTGAAAASGPSRYDALIGEAAAKYGLDPSLIKAVIRSESDFDPNAVSSAGAKGLMQLMDGTAAELGVTDAFDPAQNIDAGSRFLADLIGRYGGSPSVALAAYNAGPSRIDGLGIRSEADLADRYGLLPRETQNYVRAVLGRQRQYAEQ